MVKLMYKEYFHLNESPFRLNTDTHYLYLSKGHAKAKAYLEYALMNDENLVVLTGEIGAGKSMLIQSVLDNLTDDIVAVKIHQTQLSDVEFLQMLLLKFGIKSFHAGKIELLNQLKEFLLSVYHHGKRTLLVVDEAQNLNREVLEEIRFLTDLEVGPQKLLNVFLVGQPELDSILDQPGMEQLTQRIRLKFHLDALNENDIKDYIIYRINKAGENQTGKITGEVIPLIYSYTGGRPRLINVLCDHALTCAFVDKKKSITKDILESAINELSWIPFGRKSIDKVLPKHAQHATEGNMVAKLVISKGSDLIGEFPVSSKTINIGRSRDNDIILNDSRISRVHAQISNSNNEIYIRDMHSQNGTFLDLKQVDFAALKDGNEITIARFKLKFVEINTKQTENLNIIQYPMSDKIQGNDLA
jgi:type II secretory pathway predicted ATPase ExeA